MLAHDLIEVSTRDNALTVDTQGERVLDPNGAYAFASRLIDAAVQVSGACPLRPLADRVVVRVIEEAGRTSSGGVHIPDTARPDANRGVVLAVGPLVDNDTRHYIGTSPGSMFCRVGDIVTFSRHAGYEVTIGDLTFRAMKIADVLAVVEKPA